MDILCKFTNASFEGCEVIAQTETNVTIKQTAPQSWSHFSPLGSETDLTQMILFTGFLSNNNDRCMHCFIRFTGENRNFHYTVSLMPGLTVDLLFRMVHLNGECHYPPMEPGTLKSSISGSMRPEEIRQVSIGNSILADTMRDCLPPVSSRCPHKKTERTHTAAI